MRFNIPTLLLIAGFIGGTAQDAGARAVKGDKTLGLGMNNISWTSASYSVCDGDGKNCESLDDTEKALNFGVGASGGYLLTDLWEIGVSLGISRYSRETEWSKDYTTEESSFGLEGSGYGKVHLGSDSTVVPFLAAGLGLGISRDTYKFADEDEMKSAYAIFSLFASGGIDYYVAEKYAISLSLQVTRTAAAFDGNTDSDDNSISGVGAWIIGFGLGVSTYF